MKDLAFADHLKLPLDAATQTFGDLGKKGSGKTYGAQRRFELFHEAGVQCIALDPVGNWWNLRLGADGRSAGLPVPVFGGAKGDIPLEATAGAFIAQVVVSRGISVILDVSRFRKGERKRFMTDFAEEFFHLKKDAVSPVHLFVEESHVFVPQKVQKGEERMLGAMEDIVRIGRNYGIGTTLISQRAASVNKDVLTQVECLCAYQTSSAQDRKAIREWLDENDDEGVALLGELKGLEKGDALFWSPSWLRCFKRIHVTQKDTFDGSATPKVGAKPVKPRELAPVDLEEIREAMNEAVQVRKDNSPDHLKARIKALQAELHQARSAKDLLEPKTTVKTKRVEVPVVNEAQLKRVEALAEKADKQRDALAQAQQAFISEAGNLRTMVKQLRAQPAVGSPPAAVGARPSVLREHNGRITIDEAALRASERRVSDGSRVHEVKFKKGAYEMLQHLAVFGDKGLTRSQLATLTRIKPSGSTFSSYLSTIRTAGHISEAGDRVFITATGSEYVGDDKPSTPTSTMDLVLMWKGRIKKDGARRMLDRLVANYPSSVSREEMAQLLGGIGTSGSTLSSYLSILRTNGLLCDAGGGDVVASDTLFPEQNSN